MKRTICAFICIVLAAALVLPIGADEGTTTYNTAAKDIGDNTEIYVLTDSKPEDYPYYGAKWEPESGAYYGIITAYGKQEDDYFGMTACSLYYELNSSYSLEYWSYIYGPLVSEGKRALLIVINFPGEKNDCESVCGGMYDGKLTDDFIYLSTLDCPVFLRIAGEMNVWSNMAEPEEYIAAYRHIGDLARKYAPNIALVFSPNFSSAYSVDLDSFYPGDAYADWIGTSLYYNRYSANGDTTADAFYGVNAFGDPLLNVQQTVNLSRLHKKPVIITEGGAYHTCDGEDLSAFASFRVEKAMSYLTMLYPEIKCIVYSDSNFGIQARDYRLTTNSMVNKSFTTAVENNPTLRHGINGQVPYYGKMKDGAPIGGENITFAAYTYSPDRVEATWALDGNTVKKVSEYPFFLKLDGKSLKNGKHTLTVSFSNGASKSCSFVYGKTVAGFNDVYENSYYADSVIWALEHQVTTGTSSVTFSPDKACTRGQVVTFLWRAAGEPVIDVRNPFKDIKEDDYYYKAVLWAVENGITSGTSEDAFSPDVTCTNAHILTFIYRAAGEPGKTGEGQWYADSVNWAVESGLTAGTTDMNVTAPEYVTSPCPRCNVVTFLHRYYENIQ